MKAIHEQYDVHVDDKGLEKGRSKRVHSIITKVNKTSSPVYAPVSLACLHFYSGQTGNHPHHLHHPNRYCRHRLSRR